MKRNKKNPEVLPFVSYNKLEQDCQILEFQNYNVVQFRRCLTFSTTVILAPIIRINVQIKSGFGK